MGAGGEGPSSSAGTTAPTRGGSVVMSTDLGGFYQKLLGNNWRERLEDMNEEDFLGAFNGGGKQRITRVRPLSSSCVLVAPLRCIYSVCLPFSICLISKETPQCRKASSSCCVLLFLFLMGATTRCEGSRGRGGGRRQVVHQTGRFCFDLFLVFSAYGICGVHVLFGMAFTSLFPQEETYTRKEARRGTSRPHVSLLLYARSV